MAIELIERAASSISEDTPHSTSVHDAQSALATISVSLPEILGGNPPSSLKESALPVVDIITDMAGLAELPMDCLLRVAGYISDKCSLVSCSMTCTRWREACEAQSLWQGLFMADFCSGAVSRLSSNELGGSAISCGSSSTDEAKAEDALRLLAPESAITDWKTLYRRRREVDASWSSGDSCSRKLLGHNDYIRCAQLEGNTLVTASGSISHTDCTIRVWDLDTGLLRQLLRGHMGPIWCMAYDPSCGRIASGSDDYTVRYWDAQTGNCVSLQDPDSAVRCISIDPECRQLVAGTEFGRLMLWDTEELDDLLSTGINRVRSELQQRDIIDPPCHQVSARRVVVDGSNHVQALDGSDDSKAISAIQVQGGLCASTSVEPLSQINLWDVSAAADGSRCGSWRLIRSVGDGSMMCVNSMSFEKPLGMLVGGCGDKSMRIWDIESGECTHMLRGHTDVVTAHQFDRNMLASSSLSGHIRVWDLRNNECIHVLEHGSAIHAFQYDGSRLASGTWDGRTFLWDLSRGSKVGEWKSHEERVWALAMDDYNLVSAGLDKDICVRSFLPADLAFNRWQSL